MTDQKTFPVLPQSPTVEEMKRHELLNQLDMWANNDAEVAMKLAIVFIELIRRQFKLDSVTHKD